MMGGWREERKRMEGKWNGMTTPTHSSTSYVVSPSIWIIHFHSMFSTSQIHHIDDMIWYTPHHRWWINTILPFIAQRTLLSQSSHLVRYPFVTKGTQMSLAISGICMHFSLKAMMRVYWAPVCLHRSWCALKLRMHWLSVWCIVHKQNCWQSHTSQEEALFKLGRHTYLHDDDRQVCCDQRSSSVSSSCRRLFSCCVDSLSASSLFLFRSAVRFAASFFFASFSLSCSNISLWVPFVFANSFCAVSSLLWVFLAPQQ